jgi:hypothetical protein
MAKPADTSKPAMLTTASHTLRWITRSSKITTMAIATKISSGISSPKFKKLLLFIQKVFIY